MHDTPEVHRSDKEIKWMKGYAHIVWFIFGRICKIQVETLPLCTTLNFVPTCMYEDLDDGGEEGRAGQSWASMLQMQDTCIAGIAGDLSYHQ